MSGEQSLHLLTKIRRHCAVDEEIDGRVEHTENHAHGVTNKKNVALSAIHAEL